MLKTRRFLQILTILLAPAVVNAADPGLLRLVMPDAKVIAGLQVDSTRNSLFGQFVLSHMQLDDEGFKKFVADTGFDPRRDLREIVMASNWESAIPQSRWLVLAKGQFDASRIRQAVQANGRSVSSFQGVEIYPFSGRAKTDVENALAILDGSTGVMGDIGSVQAAVARQQADTPANSQLLGKVRDVSAKNDFWFATLVPLSEFAASMPDPNVSNVMKGNLLTAISQATGGIRFGTTVTISAEAVTRSDKDAQALVDVVKFVVNMLQLNRQNDAVAGQVASLLDTLDTRTNGNVMSMSLAIPEQQLEQIIGSAPRPNRAAPKKAAPQAN